MPECKYDVNQCDKDDVYYCGEGVFACRFYDSSKPKGEECTKEEYWNENWKKLGLQRNRYVDRS